MINLYLLARVRYDRSKPAGYNYQIPVKNFAANPADGYPAIGMPSMVSALGRALSSPTGLAAKRYIDLERGGVINVNQLKAFVAADTDGGYAGANFAIANPPP